LVIIERFICCGWDNDEHDRGEEKMYINLYITSGKTRVAGVPCVAPAEGRKAFRLL